MSYANLVFSKSTLVYSLLASLKCMYKRIENVILFIAKNFNAELTLDTLAKECGLSKFHFHRTFKLETGQTPLQYVNKLRLEFAAHFLIMYPENKLTDVAFECGYISPAVFTRSFKEFYKISPSAYRKKFSDLSRNKPKAKDFLIWLQWLIMNKMESGFLINDSIKRQKFNSVEIEKNITMSLLLVLISLHATCKESAKMKGIHGK